MNAADFEVDRIRSGKLDEIEIKKKQKRARKVYCERSGLQLPFLFLFRFPFTLRCAE
jgi:hypothetical protein